MRIALVTAHPDDAEIYAGGSIAAWRAMGAEVTIIIASDGAGGGPGDPASLSRTRKAEAERAALHLGAGLILLDLPDGGLSRHVDLVPRLERALTAVAPDLAVTHAACDYHADHRALAHATLAAASFRMPVLWLDTMMGVGFLPSHLVDITAFQSQKETAILHHQSQDPQRFVDRTRLQARFRAAQCGHDGLAEAFRHDPIYPFADVRAMLPPAPMPRAVRDRRTAIS